VVLFSTNLLARCTILPNCIFVISCAAMFHTFTSRCQTHMHVLLIRNKVETVVSANMVMTVFVLAAVSGFVIHSSYLLHRSSTEREKVMCYTLRGSKLALRVYQEKVSFPFAVS
jgi:hypothetical protein